MLCKIRCAHGRLRHEQTPHRHHRHGQRWPVDASQRPEHPADQRRWLPRARHRCDVPGADRRRAQGHPGRPVERQQRHQRRQRGRTRPGPGGDRTGARQILRRAAAGLHPARRQDLRHRHAGGCGQRRPRRDPQGFAARPGGVRQQLRRKRRPADADVRHPQRRRSRDVQGNSGGGGVHGYRHGPDHPRPAGRLPQDPRRHGRHGALCREGHRTGGPGRYRRQTGLCQEQTSV
ncbi:hypothetical protein D3C73_498590 [compost metagenome]